MSDKSKTKTAWNDDDVVRLLDTAEQYVFIYDTRDDRHKDRPLSRQTYEQIASTFGKY